MDLVIKDRASPRRASWPEALCATLLDLYELARNCTLCDFEPRAVRLLGRLIGFDGAVWGAGIMGGDRQPITITHAAVVDRPVALLSGYAEVAPCDPITARFLRMPSVPLAADVDATYRAPELSVVREYLRSYGIGQLLLLGGATSTPASMAWITAYREEPKRPFGTRDIEHLSASLPHWFQARALCASLNLGQLARDLPSSAGLAMCDRAGILHAADARFTTLTGYTVGDRVDAAMRRATPSAGAATIEVDDTGDWLILTARASEPSLGLPLRLAAVARRYAEGASYKQIARELGRSPATIRTQLQAIFARLGVHTRIELMRALAPR